jgi:hypothetical protein
MIGLAISCLLGTGCRDKCKKVSCVHGTCADGTCVCEAGYFGQDCNTVINAGFSGNYALTENCIAGTDNYAVKFVPKNGSLKDIYLIGLWEQSMDTLVAVGNETGLSFEIARQALGNYEVMGEGTSNADYSNVDLAYRIYATGSSSSLDECTATLIKN